MRSFFYHAAVSSRSHGLFLMPETSESDGFSILDPLPFVAEVIERPELWPGVLFWTARGAHAFAPLRESYSLYHRLLDALDRGGDHVDDILDEYRGRSREKSKKLLHLSDLHFGTPRAAENQAYLTAHLATVARVVDRTVITGDLFNNPVREEAVAFRTFRSTLQLLSGKEAVVIPGNHDQKWLGNKKGPLRELADLEWTNLVTDDEIRCNFFCFDSSRDADFARGKVTRQQMVDVATLFETRSAVKPALRDYLSIALIHHHPFSFETPPETILARGLEVLGITDEHFLRLEDADSFLKWCAARNIPLVLHGHKHVQKYYKAGIAYDDDQPWLRREVAAVGCGSSLGVDNVSLSYNIVAWDPATKRWGVTFFADPGDGSGFTRRRVAIQTMDEMEA